jgi:hypothetical protein
MNRTPQKSSEKMGKNSHFTKDNIEMEKRPAKIYLSSLIITVMQI